VFDWTYLLYPIGVFPQRIFEIALDDLIYRVDYYHPDFPPNLALVRSRDFAVVVGLVLVEKAIPNSQ